MLPTYFQSTFFVFLLINSFPKILTESKPSPPLNFIKNLIGTRKGTSAQGISQLKQYLSEIGYIDQKPPYNDFFDEALRLSLINYQSYFKLVTTGVLDADTVKKMMLPRCGVPDSGNFTSVSKVDGVSLYSFFPGSPKWPPSKRNLTYSFLPGGHTDVNKSISGALDLWSGVSPFRFVYTSNYEEADIKVSFRSRSHGDGKGLDGAGGFFGHAFEPCDGRVCYDGDEGWIDGVNEGVFDMQTVGLHELGHVLGLGHTTNEVSIMYPYIGLGSRRGLDIEDIRGIQDLYSSF